MNGSAKPSGIAEPASRIVFWIAVFLGLAYMFLKAYELAATDASLPSRKIDFLAFWAAAKLALGGEALAAFDPTALAAAAGVSPGEVDNLLWLYPPAFLMLIFPLGALPFWAAWVVFVLASAVCLGLAVRGPASVLPGGWRLVVISPVVLIACLAIGQTSVLWTAALVAALWAMRPDRDVAAYVWSAGLLIALLTLKPQLGLLIAVALIAGGQWRILIWTAGWAAAIALISTAAFGPGYWMDFLFSVANAANRIETGAMPIQRLSSFYGFVRALEAGHTAALLSQLAITVAMAAATAWIWRRKRVSHDLKCAALCAAIPLATPYAFYYEMTLTLAAALFLLRDGFGQGILGKLWMLVVWLGPVPAIYLPSAPSIAASTPPILMVTVVICLWRAKRRNRPARSLETPQPLG